MGFLVAIGAAICSGIAAAAAAVASVIVTISSAIYTAISWVVGATVGLFAGIGAGLLSGLGILSGDLAIGIGTSLGSISSIAGSMYFTAGAWIETLGVWFRTFLEVIHFSTLKQISDIAYVVSGDFREYMNKIYGKIGEFSSAISNDAHFAVLLLENSRSVILDTSSMLGRPYDIGQLTWLEEFEGFLKAIEKKGEKYKNNPYDLINDINELILKPAYDLKAQEMQGLLSTVDQVIQIVEGTVNDIVVVKEDMDKLIHDLPQEIRERVEPYTTYLSKTFDDFTQRKFFPAIKEFRELSDKLHETEELQNEKMRSIVDRLKRPDKYLQEIEDLPEDEQLKAYEVIADYSTKIYRQPVTAWRKQAEPYTEEFLRLGEITTKPRVAPEWQVPEVTGPSSPKAERSQGINSPFPEDV